MAISFQQYGGIKDTTYTRIISGPIAQGLNAFYNIYDSNYYLYAKAELEEDTSIVIDSLNTQLGFYYSQNTPNKGKIVFLADVTDFSTSEERTEYYTRYEYDFSQETISKNTYYNYDRKAEKVVGEGIFKGNTIYLKIIIELSDNTSYTDYFRAGVTFVGGSDTDGTLYTTFEYILAQRLGRVFIQESDGKFYPYIPYIYMSEIEGWKPYQACIYETTGWNPTKYTP